ncbi:hypothetical protein [Rhodococcus sp. RS1C4]|nr:hypothetical protein [Rhodococcus sp. RS1C4]
MRSAQRPIAVAVALVVTIVTASCSSDAAPTSSPEVTPSTAVDAAGLSTRVNLTDSAITITAPAGVAVAGTSVEVADADPIPASGAPKYVSGLASGASITLGNGEQPAKPMTLAFDLSSSSTTFTDSESAIPVIVAVPDGSSVSEVLPSTWDADRKVLTATTTHLSSFFPAVFDAKAMSSAFTSAINGFLGLDVPPPACTTQSVAIGTRTITAETSSNTVVQPCLTASGSNVDVELASLSSQGWTVSSSPNPASSVVNLPADLESIANSATFSTILAPVVGAGTFLLPGGSTSLTFDPATLPGTVTLRVEAAMNLVNILIYGLNILYPNAALFQLDSVAECMSTLVGRNGSLSGAADVGVFVKGFTTCAGGVTAEKTASLATRSLAAVLTVLPGGAALLANSITGVIGEFTGANTATVELDVTGSVTTPTSTASPAATPTEKLTARDIVGLTVSTKLAEPVITGKKLGPTLYGLNDRGQADVAFNWVPVMTDPEVDYEGDDCQVEVTITGPTAFPVVQSAECHGYFATSFNGSDNGIEVTAPGTYTVTAFDRVSGKVGVATFDVQ